jgi:hypothetical protein
VSVIPRQRSIGATAMPRACAGCGDTLGRKRFFPREWRKAEGPVCKDCSGDGSEGELELPRPVSVAGGGKRTEKRSIPTVMLRACAGCEHTLGRKRFFPREWKKAEGHVCKDCLHDGSESELPPPGGVTGGKQLIPTVMLRACAGCEHNLGRKRFFPREWKKAEGPVCKDCLHDGSESELPPPGGVVGGGGKTESSKR